MGAIVPDLMDNNVRAVYILSAGRSGSTLLNLLLGSHPEATAVGELTHLPKNLALNSECSCGSPVRECELWKPVTAHLGADPYAMELGFIDATNVIDKRKQTRAYKLAWKFRHAIMYAHWRIGLPVRSPRFTRSIETTLRLYQAIRDESGARVVVDASKGYLKGIGIYRHSEHTRLILLTRDGRASMFSRLKSGFDIERSLRAWKNYYRNALPLIEKTIPECCILRVRYEDLATNPAAELSRICTFIGLTFDVRMLDFRAVTHHVVNGNRMRVGENSRIQLDTSWETNLGTAERAYFEQHAGKLNRQLGYSVMPDDGRPAAGNAT